MKENDNMLQVRFDANSPYNVRFPKAERRAAVLALAQAFLAKEQTLPPAEQSPYVSMVEQLVTEATGASGGQSAGEAQRTQASEAAKQLDAQARQLTTQIINLFKAHFAGNLAQAMDWGVDYKQTTGNLVTPGNRAARLAFLDTYIAKELSRPEAERFPVPALATVTQVRDDLKTNLNGRFAGQTQREVNAALSASLSQRLLDTLQAAAVHLLAFTFNFQISSALQEWGYEVLTPTPVAPPPAP
jgi:hypothetical protein